MQDFSSKKPSYLGDGDGVGLNVILYLPAFDDKTSSPSAFIKAPH